MNAGIVAQGSPPIDMTLPLLGRSSPVQSICDKNGDPYWPYVSLLLRFNGSNGPTQFINESPVPGIVGTAVGTAALTTAASRFGATSLATTPSANSNHVTFGSNAAFSMGTGPFTAEAFIRVLGLPTVMGGICNVMTSATAATNIMWWFGMVPSGGQNYLQAGIHNTSTYVRTPWNPALGRWYHVAMSRVGATVRLFIDGVQQATQTNGSYANNFSASGTFAVGYVVSTPGSLNGNISEFRLTKGVARYLTSFTPPTAPFPAF